MTENSKVVAENLRTVSLLFQGMTDDFTLQDGKQLITGASIQWKRLHACLCKDAFWVGSSAEPKPRTSRHKPRLFADAFTDSNEDVTAVCNFQLFTVCEGVSGQEQQCI